jgi:hypothetical protein
MQRDVVLLAWLPLPPRPVHQVPPRLPVAQPHLELDQRLGLR